jgi:hypothetical protein
VQKLPGNPLKSLTTSYASKPGGDDVVTQTSYNVQDFMLVGTNWIPKHMTYELHNKNSLYDLDISLDQVEVSPKPLSNEDVIPKIASQTDIYDSRLKIVFKAGSAPENILNHFRVLDRTDENEGDETNEKAP